MPKPELREFRMRIARSGMSAAQARIARRIRILLVIFVIGLILSGLTAFPLETELRALRTFLAIDPAAPPSVYTGLHRWIATVARALEEIQARYPFMAYGTDWLAFAHLAIAVAFIGPLRDPVRNVWVVTFALIACAGVIPMALIAGAVRGIPLYWRILDCSFGVFGAIPLWLARRDIARLQSLQGGAAYHPASWPPRMRARRRRFLAFLQGPPSLVALGGPHQCGPPRRVIKHAKAC